MIIINSCQQERWVCIDYHKLNDAIHKIHFSLPFIDQMLEGFLDHAHFYFLDGYSSYNQIVIMLGVGDKK